jgi:hypothetical protein
LKIKNKNAVVRDQRHCCAAIVMTSAPDKDEAHETQRQPPKLQAPHQAFPSAIIVVGNMSDVKTHILDNDFQRVLHATPSNSCAIIKAKHGSTHGKCS